jgi:hypothetical protein
MADHREQIRRCKIILQQREHMYPAVARLVHTHLMLSRGNAPFQGCGHDGKA